MLPICPYFLTSYFYYLLNWKSPKLAFEVMGLASSVEDAGKLFQHQPDQQGKGPSQSTLGGKLGLRSEVLKKILPKILKSIGISTSGSENFGCIGESLNSGKSIKNKTRTY